MTTAFAPTSADVQAYAIKSVSMSGVAPQAVSEAVSADLVTAIRSAPSKSGASPVQMSVLISGFSGGKVATGYKSGADVTVTLKPTSGGKMVQTASFHEDAVSVDEAHASSQLATGIAARVRRNFNLPTSQAALASNGARAAGEHTKKAPASKPAASEKAAVDPALSNDALDTLMRAAAGTDAPQDQVKQDQTKTGSVPGQTLPVPDEACTGESLASCPQGALLSGDFSLRK
ncbi:hypothetical protein [Rhizobium sp. C4]|uniref:hypothetical protein n=1 Tax=Rhizobium sp. C4 TaxID=1349800 RepID=UPI001E5FBA7E|nr:hypothetical protein [Rhizobium sp. C4]MCD2176023.1 hypothetical protein [Rhizobium sp. C4]